MHLLYSLLVPPPSHLYTSNAWLLYPGVTFHLIQYQCMGCVKNTIEILLHFIFLDISVTSYVLFTQPSIKKFNFDINYHKTVAPILFSFKSYQKNFF